LPGDRIIAQGGTSQPGGHGPTSRATGLAFPASTAALSGVLFGSAYRGPNRADLRSIFSTSRGRLTGTWEYGARSTSTTLWLPTTAPGCFPSSDVRVNRPSLSVTPIDRGPLTSGQNSTWTFSSGFSPARRVPVTSANVGPPEHPAAASRPAVSRTAPAAG